MKSHLFITSSGTDIGKTYVTTLLCRQLRKIGRDVQAIKPVVSGFEEAGMALSDPGLLLDASGREVSHENIKTIAPWRFSAALAPDMAAAQENRELNFDDLIDFNVKSSDQSADVFLVEGVGGVMAPIAPGRLMIDWMQSLGMPVLLVVGSYLGTISHTLTAAHVIMGAGLNLRGVVITESLGSTVSLADTENSLTTFLDGVPIIALMRESDWRAQADLVSWAGL